MKAILTLSGLALSGLYSATANPLRKYNLAIRSPAPNPPSKLNATLQHPPLAADTPPAPTCSLAAGQFGSPDAWVNAGMDSYLTAFAQAQPGLWDDKTNFLPLLMSYFGWSDYSCLSDAQDNECSPNPVASVSNCTNWLNQQVAYFEGYMNSNTDILEKIQTHVSIWGESIFDLFWQAVPPSVSNAGYNASPLLEAMIGGFVGLIPEVGGIFGLINSAAEGAVSGIAADQVIVPDLDAIQHKAWVAINTAMEVQISNLTGIINEYSRNIVKSNTVLTEVTKGGAFFLANDTSLQPDPEKVWGKVEPYWASKIAMAAMKAQEVFLLSVPVTLQPAKGTCTQAMADELAHYVSGKTKGVAWCAGDYQVIVPVVSPIYGQPQVSTYTPFANISTTGSSNLDVQAASSNCYPGFSPNNPKIELYKPSNQNASVDGTFDLSAPCAWSLPICDYASWAPVMMKQCDNDYTCGSPVKPTMTNSDMVVNVAQWCAYQFGFANSVWLCDEEDKDGPNQGRYCGQWGGNSKFPAVPKVFQVS